MMSAFKRTSPMAPRRHLLRTLLGVVALAAIMAPLDALAATYYVDRSHPSANDTNPGTEALPWLTMLRAMQVAVAGDTVYVKSGAYPESNSSFDNDGPRAALRPLNSGSASAPIAFRVYPGHQVTLEVSIQGSSSNDYITWHGFTLATGHLIQMYGAESDYVVGTVIDNCTVQRGQVAESPGGNYDGVFIQYVQETVIRNCVFRDINTTGSTRGSAIKMYFAFNSLIENNEIYRADDGIFSKGTGQFNVFRYNYIHDIEDIGIGFACFGGHGALGCASAEVYQNVITNATDGIRIGDVISPTTFSDFRVYNNTINVTELGMKNGFTPGLRVWNNIIRLSNSLGWAMGIVNITTDLVLSDYSNFYPVARFLSDELQPTMSTYSSLAAWQGTGFDLNSRNVDPLFVGPLVSMGPPTAFRLQAGSSLVNAGRVGGVSTGAPVNMGAYVSDTDVIGPRSRDSVAAANPTGLEVR